MTPLISRADLADLIEAGHVTVIDALPEAYYERMHLPGALNLVAADVDVRAPELLPDKSAAIVTYCSGPTCSNSHLVADRLLALGYTNVRKYQDGIQDWFEAGLPTETGIHV
jgi:rhodanese-related sulfurtransferase